MAPVGKAEPLVLILQDRFSERIDLDGGRPCLVHHDLPWNPARLTQRWGRVVRAGSGLVPVAPDDIYIPVLDVEVDRRLADTIAARARIGAILLPPQLADDDTEDNGASERATMQLLEHLVEPIGMT